MQITIIVIIVIIYCKRIEIFKCALRTFLLLLQKPRNFQNCGRGSAFNELTSTDSRYFFAKEKEFSSKDAINVSADAKDATECCNPANSTPKQHTSP